MADAAELAFVKTFVGTIGTLPVQYPDDYQQPPENSLKKVPVLPIDVPPVPEPKAQSNGASSGSITITIKVTKPPKSFTLSSVAPTDTVSDLKGALAKQAGAPPADAQRLLLRGKALADNKLLKEFGVKDGDVVNLMLKPGFEWDWSSTTSSNAKVEEKDLEGDVMMKPPPGTVPLVSPRVSRSSSKGGKMHARIPSVVLSPSPTAAPSSADLLSPSSPIPLSLDTAHIPNASSLTSKDQFRTKIASTNLWLRLHRFLLNEFDDGDEAAKAFELFLLGSKGELTPSEIAKIRDTVGLTGMAGVL